ncbi:MAG: Fur family transcriptional regulator [Candidatus Thermoplasmatota archaeon]
MLKEKNLKVTPQRIEILKYLDKNRTHPNAEEIYQGVKEDNPSISKTTVYNSLEKLKENNLIQSLSICPSEKRYDFNEQLHHHFYCKKCGRVIDLDFRCPNMEKIHEEIKSKGHQIDEAHGYFKGICKNCVKKNE